MKCATHNSESHCRLRLLWPGTVSRMRQGFAWATHGLFERLRNGAVAFRHGDPIDSQKERAKRPSQRFLLLPVRNSIGGRRRRGVFPIAVTVLDFLHRRLRSGLVAFWILVWPDRQEPETWLAGLDLACSELRRYAVGEMSLAVRLKTGLQRPVTITSPHRKPARSPLRSNPAGSLS